MAGGAERFAIDVPTEITVALDASAPVFIGVSGGRDSQALAYRVCAHLDDIEYSGPRFLVHADLGRVEWEDSLLICERLTERLGVELVVVRRNAGDMMDRWLSRWAANVARYANLECARSSPGKCAGAFQRVMSYPPWASGEKRAPRGRACRPGSRTSARHASAA